MDRSTHGRPAYGATGPAFPTANRRRSVAIPRQQTLRAAVDWSYDLLSEPQQRLFNRLSVFAGGWTLEAAEAVCSGDGIEPGDVLDMVLQLVRKSLVVAEENRDGAERYRLLETLRQYAHERLIEAGEIETVRARHATCYLTLAEEAAPRSTLRAWPERLLIEHDNLRAAMRWLLESNAVEQAVRLGGLLYTVWVFGGLPHRRPRPIAHSTRTTRSVTRVSGLGPARLVRWLCGFLQRRQRRGQRQDGAGGRGAADDR